MLTGSILAVGVLCLLGAYLLWEYCAYWEHTCCGRSVLTGSILAVGVLCLLGAYLLWEYCAWVIRTKDRLVADVVFKCFVVDGCSYGRYGL